MALARVGGAGKERAAMLAYLTDEPPTAHEEVALDPTLVAPAPGDQATPAQVAYEAAQHIEAACWIPARRRRPGARRREVPA
jgi:hypothetical protein